MRSHLSNANECYTRIKRVNPNDPIAKLDYYLSAISSSDSSGCKRAPGDKAPARRNEFKTATSTPESPSAHSSLSPTGFQARRRRVEDELISEGRLHSVSSMSSCERALATQGLRLEKPTTTLGYSVSAELLNHSELTDWYMRADEKSQTNRRQAKQKSSFASSPPMESSGFSEGNTSHLKPWKRSHNKLGPIQATGGGANQRANFVLPPHYSNASPLASTNSSRKSSAGNQANGGHNVRWQSPYQPAGRSRRRKITRMNRRMLGGGAGEQPGAFSYNAYALSELFSQSEIPGFREIFASDSYLRKFCWIVAFLFMTVLSLNDMTELITEYYEYPITVDVRLRDSARLPFPAVTVCNLNVVKFSSLCSNRQAELAHQIPSELRDKLCGIQVEKSKKNQTTSDSDISDINNIGITTTSTSASTSATTKTIATTAAPEAALTPPQDPDSASKNVSQIALAAADIITSTTVRPPLTAGPPLGLAPLLSYSSAYTWPVRHRAGRSVQTSDGERPFASRRGSVRVPAPADRNKPIAGQFNSKLENLSLTQAAALGGGGSTAGQPSRPLGVWPANGGGSSQSQPSRNIGQQTVAPSRVPPSFIVPQSAVSPTPGVAAGPGGGAVQTGAGVINGGLSNKNQNNALGSFVVPPSGSESADFELTERQERELQENLTNWLAVMFQRDPPLTRSLGHQFDDMILRCTMKSINCTRQRAFENSFSPTEGNCFTFRSRVKRRRPGAAGDGQQSPQNQWDNYEEANLAGTNDGLELVLNLEKNEYISGSSQVGALVMIHHPSDLGYAASEATFIAPEFTTYIGLKMINITRLPAPYPEYCVDSWPAKFADNLTRNSTYSQQACLKICLQKTIQAHCNCQSAFLPIVELDSSQQQTNYNNNLNNSNNYNYNNSQPTGDGANGTATKPTGEQQPRIIICDTRKRSTRTCVREVNLRAADRVHNCECPPKCQVVRYDKTISMARWPTREDKVSFDRGKLDVNFQNLAKVIVYFQTMTCEEVTQQAVFNAAKLFSALGGIMGMYVGFSFLSVFEIFEVMSRKFWHYLRLRLIARCS